jgi:hypothetical protein
MSNEPERGGIGRLWSAGTARDRPARPEPQQRPADNVVQLRPDRAYVAHEIRDHAQRLHICCATQPSRYPAYSSLLDIIHDHNFDKAFTLVYSFMLVEVTGNRLGAIVWCRWIVDMRASFPRPWTPGTLSLVLITPADTPHHWLL